MDSVKNKIKFHDARGVVKNYLGVELEISCFNPKYEPHLAKVLNFWKASCGADGSIEPTGKFPNSFEIKTSPARGSKFTAQIKDICAVLKKGEAEANQSCGLHVHMDCRDITPNDYFKITTLWPKLEKEFWNQTFKDRKDNEYCVPWDSYQIKLEKNDSLIGMFREAQESTYHDRYESLNLQALDELGTIENRMHHGSVDPKEIIEWGRMNDRFLTYVKKTSIREALSANRKVLKDVVKSNRRTPFTRKLENLDSLDYETTW